MIPAINQRTHGTVLEATASSLAGPHVAVLFYRFGPYHHARLKAAGTRMRVTGIEFSNVDPTYAWDLVEGAEGFNRLTLFSGMAVNELPASRIFSRVGQALDQLQPQVVAIPGWYDRCSLAALRWCCSHGVPAVVMSETTAWDSERTWLKEAMKRRLMKLCASGLVGGRAHAEYLEKLGIDRSRIFIGYDVVDNDYFAAKTAEVRSQRSEVRGQNGLPENYFLASARFIEKKNLSRLISAYARYRELVAKVESEKQKAETWNLVILGDGPLRGALNPQLSTLNLLDHVLLPGFKQYGELPLYYGLARAFIHASTVEQWGLVVNEAMASGLPVLVSNRCGCAPDLVQEGQNGFSFDPYDVEALAKLMLKVSAGNFPLSEFGLASRQIAETFGVSAFATGMSGAVAHALRNPAPQLSLVDNLCISSLIHSFRDAPVEGLPTRNGVSETRHGQNKDTKFLVFRYHGRDVLAVPEKSKAAWLEGAKRFQPFTPRRLLYRSALSCVMRFGGIRLVAVSRTNPVDQACNFNFNLWQTELAGKLGRSITHVIVTWPSEPSRRRLYVHLLDAGLRAFAFVKVALMVEDRARLETEAEALRAMSNAPFEKIRVPNLLSHDSFGNASYLVVEPLPAKARPLALKQDSDNSTLTAEFRGQRNRISGAEIMKLSWWSDYTKGLQAGHQAFHEELSQLLPLGADVCRVHGDLGLANMVTDGARVWIFDWELSHASGPALADAVGFFMSFTVGKNPRDYAGQLASFRNRFLSDNSEQHRLAVMLAVAFRQAGGIPDAGRLMTAWTGRSG